MYQRNKILSEKSKEAEHIKKLIYKTPGITVTFIGGSPIT